MSFLLAEKYKPETGHHPHNDSSIPQVPATVNAVVDSNDENVIDQSFILQFIGMLVPEDCEDHRTYLFVRSLANLSHLDQDHPLGRLLKARAYYYLHRRPAAVHILRQAEIPEEFALLHLLNGNLPELKSAVDPLKPSLARLMAQMELFELSGHYKKR